MNSLSVHRESVLTSVSIDKVQNKTKALVDFAAVVQSQADSLSLNCKERAIKKLNEVDDAIEELLPNHIIQTELDRIGQYIDRLFEPLVPFSNWLKTNDFGSWKQALVTLLCRFPLRTVHSLIEPLYLIIKGLAFGVVHPLKAASDVAKLLITVAHELTKIETWSKMGCRMLGTVMGQSLVTRNLLSLIGIGIGAAMVVGGVSIGALQAALEAEAGTRRDAVRSYFLSQAEQLTEALFTGFYMGLIMGGIEKAVTRYQKVHNLYRYSDSREFVDDFVYYKNLPQYDATKDFMSGQRILWTSPEQIDQLKQRLPDIFTSIPAGKTAYEVHLLVDTNYLNSDGWKEFIVWYHDKRSEHLCHYVESKGYVCEMVSLPGIETTSAVFKDQIVQVMDRHSY